MPTGISVNRYARVIAEDIMQRVWVGAIRRLMAEKGYKSDSAFCEAHGIRKNTFSDALNEKKETHSRISTFVQIAESLGVPLWALFVDSAQYAMFSEQAKQRAAAETAHAQTEKITAAVLSQIGPLIETAVAQMTGQSVAQAVNQSPSTPVLIVKQPPKPRKRGR